MEKETVSLNVLIPVERKAQLEGLARGRDETVSKLAREILCKGLDREEKKLKSKWRKK